MSAAVASPGPSLVRVIRRASSPLGLEAPVVVRLGLEVHLEIFGSLKTDVCHGISFRAASPQALLFRIELDDQVFLYGQGDVRPGGQGQDPAAPLVPVDLEPS